MPNNTRLNLGSGGELIATDEVIDGALGTVQVQYVKLMDGTLDGTTKSTVGAGGLVVDLGANNDVTITGPLPALVAGSANIGDVDVLSVPAPLNVVGGGAEATALRVTLASDSTGVLSVGDNSASLTVDLPPTTTGGLSKHHLVALGSTNPTIVKASPGQLYGWYIYNNATSVRKIAFHDQTGAPTAGTAVYFAFAIPAGGGANAFVPHGITFPTGITFTTVTGLDNSSAVAVTASDLVIVLFFK